METLQGIDADIVIWLNQLAGRFRVLDAVEKALVSDYLVPACIGLCLIAMWFSGSPDRRDSRHRAGITALATVGFASGAVLILNEYYFRPRPFVDHELTVLFYMPTDSSFPAHPAVVGFGMAAGAWQGSRKFGAAVYALAFLWGFSRIFAGVFYPLDILAGAGIGIVVSYLVALGLRLIEPIPTHVLRGARTLHLG